MFAFRFVHARIQSGLHLAVAMAFFWLGSQSNADTTVLFATAVSESPAGSAWSSESNSVGDPLCAASCNCDATDSSRNVTVANRAYLVSDEFDFFTLPQNHRITSLRFNVLARYGPGSLPTTSRIRMYVDSEPTFCPPYSDDQAPGCVKTSHETQSWQSDSTNCLWRDWGAGSDLELVGLHPIAGNIWDEAAVNRLRVGVRASGNIDDPFLVKAFRLLVTHENSCGNGAVDGKGEQCDLGATNGAPGACCDSTCRFSESDTLCRTAAGSCDPAEFCTGTSSLCPADVSTCAVCPDGSCSDGEGCSSCPQDCGQCAGAFPARCDFDGDRVSDLTVWRRSTATWHVLTSSGAPPAGVGWLPDSDGWRKMWGQRSHTPFVADFDGDGLCDLAAVSRSLLWTLDLSTGASRQVRFGRRGDKLSAADCLPNPITAPGNVDGKDDLVVYRRSERNAHMMNSATQDRFFVPVAPSARRVRSVVPLSQFHRRGVRQEARSFLIRYSSTTGERRLRFEHTFVGYASGTFPNNSDIDITGSPRALPLIGDYNGDGDSDNVLYDRGSWRIILTLAGTPELLQNFGGASDTPVAGDFNGDGTDDLAVWSPVSGHWQVLANGPAPPHFQALGGARYGRTWGRRGDSLPGQ